MRFIEDGDWYADCPVVLDFDGVQIEISHSKLDELSIGWNTIDTGRFNIANGLDENNIEVGDAHPEWVRYSLGCGTQPD
ncbi:hypothetical protein [Spongiactinospora sp. TRM90649]|uniref:hypothetical protein n=1 Tax=Spongiactinospora sp. TRM90649 TaxID=3031114 RepID=UPI0023F6232C|nr:hypothetical protein [Spongiactinospora sp. TRM90649]MDF5755900.1 hypothetical protein [Spongiactinospora sp. TRM90649]